RTRRGALDEVGHLYSERLAPFGSEDTLTGRGFDTNPIRRRDVVERRGGLRPNDAHAPHFFGVRARKLNTRGGDGGRARIDHDAFAILNRGEVEVGDRAATKLAEHGHVMRSQAPQGRRSAIATYGKPHSMKMDELSKRSGTNELQ